MIACLCLLMIKSYLRSPGGRAWWSSRGWRRAPRRRWTLPADVWASDDGRTSPSASPRVPGTKQMKLTLLRPSWTTVCVRPHLVFDLPPGQLAHQELHQHVEERPQVVMATHLLHNHTTLGQGWVWLHAVTSPWGLTHLVLVRIDRSISNRPPEASHGARLRHKDRARCTRKYGVQGGQGPTSGHIWRASPQKLVFTTIKQSFSIVEASRRAGTVAKGTLNV